MHLDDMLRRLVESDASDLHLRVNEPPIFRQNGSLQRQTDLPKLSNEDVKKIIYDVFPAESIEKLEQTKELDVAYELKGVARFRVNVFYQQRVLGAAMRLIPYNIRSIDDLGVPQAIKGLCMLPRGLILVTGPTGSGKTTTLAAMINHVNTHRKCHIITIEEPIEYMHTDNLSIINQREVGVDTHGYASALRHVMRQNPDVILVGEMRDLETIHLAITAAETGHLVFSTLHTQDAPQTIDRIVDVFPSDQQQQVRMQLSVTINGVISQTLLPKASGKGRVAAYELMVATPAVRSLIREGKTHQLYMDIQTGGDVGMQTLDSCLLDLVKKGVVKYEDALGKTSNPNDFNQRIQKFQQQQNPQQQSQQQQQQQQKKN